MCKEKVDRPALLARLITDRASADGHLCCTQLRIRDTLTDAVLDCQEGPGDDECDDNSSK